MTKRVRLNSGYWLAKHIQRGAISKTGRIVVGPFVTMLAEYLRLPEVQRVQVEGHPWLDLATLITMGLVRRVGDRHILVDQPQPEEQQSDDDEDMPDHSAPAIDDPPAPSAPMPERPSQMDPSASTSFPSCDHTAHFAEIMQDRKSVV